MTHLDVFSQPIHCQWSLITTINGRQGPTVRRRWERNKNRSIFLGSDSLLITRSAAFYFLYFIIPNTNCSYLWHLSLITDFFISFLGLYVSVNSKPDLPYRATPGDSHVVTARGLGFGPTFFCGGRGFELEKFSTLLKENNAGTSRFVSKKTEGSLKSRCSCAVSYQFWHKQ